MRRNPGLQSRYCCETWGEGNCCRWPPTSAQRATKGWTLKEGKTRWIITGLAGVLWVAVITAATIIQPHLQVFQTLWLATLIATLSAIALWMTRPDHGTLNRLRMGSTLQRLETAVREEAVADEEEKQRRKQGRLSSVA